MPPIPADVAPGRGVPNTFLQELVKGLKEPMFREVGYYPPRNALNITDTALPRPGNTRYGFTFGEEEQVRVELFIDTHDKQRNKAIFDALKKQQRMVEAEFGESLRWERLDDGDGSRIAIYRGGRIDDAEYTLREIRRWAILRLLKFKLVINPRLKQLGSLGQPEASS